MNRHIWQDPIFEHVFTLKDLSANPWFWGPICILGWIFGSLMFRNFIARLWIRRSLKENGRAHLDSDDRSALGFLRWLFPFSMIVWIVIVVIQWLITTGIDWQASALRKIQHEEEELAKARKNK